MIDRMPNARNYFVVLLNINTYYEVIMYGCLNIVGYTTMEKLFPKMSCNDM